MKKFAVIFSFFIAIALNAQQKLNIPEIRKAALDSSSANFHEKLVYRFAVDPSSLSSEQLTHLYYGQSKSADLGEYFENRRKFVDLMQKGKFKEGIKRGEELFIKNPLDIELLAFLIIAYENADAQNKLFPLRGQQFRSLLDAVFQNGEGPEKDRTFTVMSVADEYTIAHVLKKDLSIYNRSSKPVKNGMADVWTRKNDKVTFVVIYSDPE